jgi:hypothetical protein
VLTAALWTQAHANLALSFALKAWSAWRAGPPAGWWAGWRDCWRSSRTARASSRVLAPPQWRHLRPCLQRTQREHMRPSNQGMTRHLSWDNN